MLQTDCEFSDILACTRACTCMFMTRYARVSLRAPRTSRSFHCVDASDFHNIVHHIYHGQLIESHIHNG
jgi:hypothetical protein